METVTVIGLGGMGMAIGERIADRGHRAYGVDLDPARRSLWEERTGAPAFADLADLCLAEITRALVVVRLTEQATEVLRALAEHDLTAYVVTTLRTETARELGGLSGPRVVELPVTGGEAAARQGRLTALAAPQIDEDDRAFLTGTIADRVVTFPAYGEPALAKLLNNVTGAFNALALARMLELAEEAGLDPRRLYEVLLTGSGGSWMTRAFGHLHDDLLEKDAALLREEVGRLPALTLDDGTDLAAILSRARTLLE